MFPRKPGPLKRVNASWSEMSARARVTTIVGVVLGAVVLVLVAVAIVNAAMSPPAPSFVTQFDVDKKDLQAVQQFDIDVKDLRDRQALACPLWSLYEIASEVQTIADQTSQSSRDVIEAVLANVNYAYGQGCDEALNFGRLGF
jgi:hypothetical protein